MLLRMAFAIDGSRFLLTYSQSDPLTREIIKHHLETIAPIDLVAVAQETHLDGLNHHHAVVIFSKRIKRRKNVFSIEPHICNVQNLRTKKDVSNALKYIQKQDKNVLKAGKESPDLEKMDRKEKIEYALNHTDQECVMSGEFSFSELRNIQYIRGMAMEEWPDYKKRDVYWLFGKSGSGKTRHAWERLKEDYQRKDIWCSSGDLKQFFNGYRGQKGVILDDLRPGSIKFEMLLRILDGYPVDISVKGSYIPWLAEKIYITAPVAPCDMYVNRETGETWDNIDQLLRRLDSQINFDGEVVTWDDDEQTIRRAIGY